MKIKNSHIEQNGFKPVSIELTFENEKEFAMFYSIFSHAAICKALRPIINPEEIRDYLETQNQIINCYDVDYAGIFLEFANSMATRYES